MCKDAPCCGCCGPETFASEPEQSHDGAGFPGCGDGSDDLADLMATGDEGCCDGPEDNYTGLDQFGESD